LFKFSIFPNPAEDSNKVNSILIEFFHLFHQMKIEKALTHESDNQFPFVIYPLKEESKSSSLPPIQQKFNKSILKRK
jgi:hypothetical protein